MMHTLSLLADAIQDLTQAQGRQRASFLKSAEEMVREALDRIREDRCPRTVHVTHGRYLSKCRKGYDTVLGYLAKHFPQRLDLMDDTADATLRDGFWLSNQCKRQGIEPRKVKACLALQEQGIKEVNSYPFHLLERRFD